LMVQEKTQDKKLPLRHTFMLETIMDLKNNKRKKVDTLTDQERLQKFVANIVKKKSGSSSSQPLRFGLDDVRDGDKKGKWWLVGAAWSGHQDSSNVRLEYEEQPNQVSDNQLLQLARKMNMNTDIRRNIFVTIMSSEDYVDAFEKLMKMGLKDKQDREIVRVLIHCTAHEKVYNPYYALISQRMCHSNHSFKITFQYSLWDELKTMDEASVQRIANVAKLYAHLFATQSLSLIVLRTISLPDLSKKHMLFLRALFYTLLSTPKQDLGKFFHTIFGKIPSSEEYEILRDTISIFLHKYLGRGDANDVVPEAEQEVIRQRVKMVKDVFKASFQ
jgi:nucleolar MIF4G domain-containing protein 1